MYAKSKNLASEMLPKGFKAVKCKTSLKLAAARIKLLRNKREVQVKHMRRDLAQLLEAGQDQTARIRVEHVIREEKTMSAYELIELYCELIVARLSIIESQKTCPIDLKEAIASVIFASPRCADLPELMDVRKHLTAKYGKEFATAALEVRPDCGVSRLVVEKLSARAPDVETKMKTLTAIANDHNVKWDPKAFEDELQKPKDDLLDGPKTFASASKNPMEFSSVKASPDPSQKMAENDVVNDPSNFEAFSLSRVTTPNTSVPVAPQSGSGTSESRNNNYRVQEAKYAQYREESSPDRQKWNMEFKDAASAAQAAAESAERASMAARAAVELSGRGNVSYDARNEGSKEKKGPTPKDERFEQSVNLEDHETKGSQGVKAERTTLGRDQESQVSYMGVAESKYDTHAQISRSPTRSPVKSRSASVYDDLSYAQAEKSYSASEVKEQDYDDKKRESAEFVQRNEKFTNSASFNENIFWNSSTQKHEIHGEGISGSNHGQPMYSEPAAVAVFDDSDSDKDDYSAFDRFSKGNLFDSFSRQGGEEPTNISSETHLFSPKQRRSEFVEDSRSEMHSVTDPEPPLLSKFVTEGIVASPSNDNVPLVFDDSDGLSSLSDNEPDYTMPKEVMEPNSSLHYQKSSKGALLSAESPRNASAPRNLNSSTDEDMHPSQVSLAAPSLDKSENKNKSGMISSHLDTEDYDNSDDFNRESEGGLSLGRLTGGFRHKGFPHPPYVRRTIADGSSQSNHSSVDSPAIIEEPVPSNHDRTSGSFIVPDLESHTQEPNLSAQMSNSRAPNAYKDSESEKMEELKSRRTLGNRGYTGASATLYRTAEDNSHIVEKPSFSTQDRTSTSLEIPVRESYSPRSQKPESRELASNSRVSYFDPSSVEKHHHAGVSDYKGNTSTALNEGTDSTTTVGKPSFLRPMNTTRSSEIPQDLYDQKQHLNAYKELSSGKKITDFDSDSDDEGMIEPKSTVRGNNIVKLSRRTRGLPSEGRRDSVSKFAGRSGMPDPPEVVIKTTQEGLSSESISRTIEQGMKGREGSNSVLPKSSVDQSSTLSQNKSSASKESSEAKPAKLSMSQIAASENNGSFKTSSSSPGVKNAPHVHPKLPDYETFAAHFRSLRPNHP